MFAAICIAVLAGVLGYTGARAARRRLKDASRTIDRILDDELSPKAPQQRQDDAA